MSLYSDYLKETGQRHIVEDASGFATFQLLGSECYIVDIYVIPKMRKFNRASQMADQIIVIAKAAGCTLLTGSVNTKTNDPTASIKVLLAYGMKFLRSNENILFFGKEI